MQKLWFGGVAALAGAGAFSLTFVIWPLPRGLTLPPPDLWPYFAFIIGAESLSFGIGVAFLIFGFPLIKRLGVTRFAAWGGYLGIAWLFMNWWPHESFHRTTLSGEFARVLWIQYTFHLSMMLAAGLVAYFFLEVARINRKQQEITIHDGSARQAGIGRIQGTGS